MNPTWFAVWAAQDAIDEDALKRRVASLPLREQEKSLQEFAVELQVRKIRREAEWSLHMAEIFSERTKPHREKPKIIRLLLATLAACASLVGMCVML